MSYFLRQKGAEVRLFTALPPIAPKQLADFQKATGLRFPTDFRTLTRDHTGGWFFHWSLKYEAENRFLTPPDDASFGMCGGNADAPFIGGMDFSLWLNGPDASEGGTLLNRYQAFQEMCQQVMLAPETETLLPVLFPLFETQGGSGDAVVIRLDTDPCEIVYLDHDDDYTIDESHVIGHGLEDFLRRWANLGFPALSYGTPLVNSTTHDIDDQSDVAKAWLEWLRDPGAR